MAYLGSAGSFYAFSSFALHIISSSVFFLKAYNQYPTHFPFSFTGRALFRKTGWKHILITPMINRPDLCTIIQENKTMWAVLD